MNIWTIKDGKMISEEGWRKPIVSGAQEGNCVNVKVVDRSEAKDLGME